MNVNNGKIKLLIAIPTLNIGGAEVFCSNLATELAKDSKYDVHLLVFSGKITDKFSFLSTNKSITIHFLNKKIGFSISAIFRLKRIIKEIGPDIINTHSSHTLRYMLLIWSNRKIPIIHTITNNPEIYNKYCFHLYKIRMHQKSWSKLHFVGISQTISDTLSRIYGLSKNRISTIHNGLYPLIENGKEKKEFDFFNCANLSPIKRHCLLLESFSLMKNKSATLCIAGNGPEKEKLLSLCLKLKISNRVTFLGSVDDPTHYYFSSRCFILTSYSEGNPITINEAFSAGLPVIAPSVGGIPDLITDGINGYLFERDSGPANIALIMDKMYKMPDSQLLYFKNQNQEKIKEWYMPNIAEKYDKLFMEKYSK